MAALTAAISRLDPSLPPSSSTSVASAASAAQAPPKSSSHSSSPSHVPGIHRRKSGLQIRVSGEGYGGARAGKLRSGNQRMPELCTGAAGFREASNSRAISGAFSHYTGLQVRDLGEGYGSATAGMLQSSNQGMQDGAAAFRVSSNSRSSSGAFSHGAGLQIRFLGDACGSARAGKLWSWNRGMQELELGARAAAFRVSSNFRSNSGAFSHCTGLQFRIREDGYGGFKVKNVGSTRCSSAGAEEMQPQSESEQEFLGSRDPVVALPLPQRIALFYDAFWRFLRPHTIRGTFLGTTALVARALLENPSLVDWSLLPKALRGLLALLCGNGFIVGINQIYDFGIDKVNKPFLPIAAGDLSVPAAWALVAGLAVLGVGIVGSNFGPLITTLYSFGLFLGTVYSVPPFRLKQHPVPAFLIIATVRGFLLNFGVYYATRAALGLPYVWSPSVIFITMFVTVFATVIAITKDLPDIEGDKKFNISTFASKMGVRRISFLGAGLLLANYVGAIVAAFYLPHAFRRNIMVAGHAVLGLSLAYQTWLLDAKKYSKDAIAGFYRFIWNLFYSEYALFPFI